MERFIFFFNPMPTSPISPSLPQAPECFATPAAHQSEQTEQAVAIASSSRPDSPKPHASQVLVSRRRPSALLQRELRHFPLAKLNLLAFGMVVDQLQREHPKTIRALALTSKQMYAQVRATGKLQRNALCQRGESASIAGKNGATILKEVIDAAMDEKNHLVSEDKLAVLASCAWSIKRSTATIAEKIIELVESLRPEHRCEGVSYACNAIKSEFADETKIGLFDRLAELAVHAKTDADKAKGLDLLDAVERLPSKDRISRFDKLASLWENTAGEEEKYVGLVTIFQAISEFSTTIDPEESLEIPQVKRYIKYLRLAATELKRSIHKKELIPLLNGYFQYAVPQQEKPTIFTEVVALANSITDADHRRRALNELR